MSTAPRNSNVKLIPLSASVCRRNQLGKKQSALRVSGEEVRELSERHRQQLELIRHESDAQRNAAEQVRQMRR
jgi:hypothetical protein